MIVKTSDEEDDANTRLPEQRSWSIFSFVNALRLEILTTAQPLKKSFITSWIILRRWEQVRF